MALNIWLLRVAVVVLEERAEARLLALVLVVLAVIEQQVDLY
jgi:hypothetical protein